MSIISISGKKGAGKDLVGKIIQYYMFMDIPIKNRYYPMDEFIHEYLLNTNINLNKESGYTIKKFAAKVKEVCSIITGIPVERFDNHDFKNSLLGDEWIRYGYADGFSHVYYNSEKETIMHHKDCSKERYEIERRVNWQTAYKHEYSVREIMQRVGTEAIRNQIHPNTWIISLFADYKPYPYTMGNRQPDDIDDMPFDLPNWIITDTRFLNEIEAVHKYDGICINVIRDNGTRAIDLHPSECELDNYTFDYVLDNDSDINSLMVKVRTLLQTLKLIK